MVKHSPNHEQFQSAGHCAVHPDLRPNMGHIRVHARGRADLAARRRVERLRRLRGGHVLDDHRRDDDRHLSELPLQFTICHRQRRGD